MASRGQSLTVQYVAWDTANNVGKTGDSANHTLRWVKDGTSAAPTNSPSEVDSTNAPGVYKLSLTATECTCDVGTLCGKSSTSDIVIIPLTVTFEQLPTAAAGANGGLPTVDASNRIAGIQGTLTTLDALADGKTVKDAYEKAEAARAAAVAAQSAAESAETAAENAEATADAIKTTTDKLDAMVEADGADWRFDANALELAPAGGGGAGGDWSDAEKQQIRKALGLSGQAAPTTGSGNLDAVLSKVQALAGLPAVATSAVAAAGEDVVRFRGDTAPTAFELGRDITGAALRFTVKRRATDPQSAALIIKSSAQPSEIEITDPAAGAFAVHFAPGDTAALLPDGRRAAFLYDVEMTLDGAVETIFAGDFILLPDISTD